MASSPLHPFVRRNVASITKSFSTRIISSSSFSTSAANNNSNTIAAAIHSSSNNSSSRNKNGIHKSTAAAVATASLALGYTLGRINSSNNNDNDNKEPHDHQKRVLPSGLPRNCCSCSSSPPPLTEVQKSLPSKLSKIVGSTNVIDGTTESSTNAPFLRGMRLGKGTALCIVTPTTLREAVSCLQEIVDADCAVVPQGANTGLTGGSVPRDDDDDDETKKRPSVVLSTKHLKTMFPIDDGKRVVCLAGAGISTLSNNLSTWGFHDRESHSVLGSIFLDPTTAAGVAFGSGGTQLRKGPAYTDRALFCRVKTNKWNENVIEVVNTLGIAGLEDEDYPLNKGNALDSLDAYAMDVKQGYRRAMASSSESVHGKAKASDAQDYSKNICVEDGTVSRYNADTKGEDCNRSEGKVLILATVHDTFPKPMESKSFMISFASLDSALRFRRKVCLNNSQDLPMSVEYMDRDSFDVIDEAGRIMANVIKVVGMTGGLVGAMWTAKTKIEALPVDGADLWIDKLLHFCNFVAPAILPSRFMNAGKKMDHHILLTVGEYGGGTMDRFLERMDQFVEEENNNKSSSSSTEELVIVNECQKQSEETSLSAFRFVAAPAFRTWCVGEGVQGISVDYALPKNGGAVPNITSKDMSDDTKTPVAAAAVPLKRMRYSHFGCNVVHEDIAYGPDVDVHEAKMDLKKSVEKLSGGKLPAEHGHGTEYSAPEDTKERWMKMDPLNVMNPGVGGLSSKKRYGE